MPTEIKAYRCQFKGCTRSPTITKKPWLSHEKTCFYNPERRACKICFWYKSDQADDRYEGYITNVCTKPNFEPPKMYFDKGICYDCQGFSRNGPKELN